MNTFEYPPLLSARVPAWSKRRVKGKQMAETIAELIDLVAECAIDRSDTAIEPLSNCWPNANR